MDYRVPCENGTTDACGGPLQNQHVAKPCQNFDLKSRLKSTMADPDGDKMNVVPIVNAIDRLNTTIESISSHLLALNDRMERQDRRIMEISHEISSAGVKSMGEQQEPPQSPYELHRHQVQRSSYSYQQELPNTEKNSLQENIFKSPASGGKFEDVPGLVHRNRNLDNELSTNSLHKLHRHVDKNQTKPEVPSDLKSDISTMKNKVIETKWHGHLMDRWLTECYVVSLK